MREPRVITVSIDAQDVRLLVRPVTVAAAAALVALGSARGPVVSWPVTIPAALATLLIEFVELPAGEVEVDGQPIRTFPDLLGRFAARPDVGRTLQVAVLETARLSEQERRDLAVGVRFLWWLPSAVGSWRETQSSCAQCIEANLCEARGCDGTVQRTPNGKKRTVWHDHQITVNVCPVRSLTPDVQAVLWWTDLCYGPQDGRYRRVALPAAGGIDQQDAWLLDAMAHVAGVRNKLIASGEEHRTQRDDSGDDDGEEDA